MAFLSLHSARNVMGLFLSKLASSSRSAEEDTSRYPPPPPVNTTRDVARSLNELINSVVDVDPDGPEGGFWEDKTVNQAVKTVSESLMKWVTQNMRRSMSEKLNRSFGVTLYELYDRQKGGSPTKTKPVARFESPMTLLPANVYSRFAEMLTDDSADEEEKKTYTPDEVREDYRYVARPRSFYDETDLRLNSSQISESARSMVNALFGHYFKDPRRFAMKIAEKRVGKNPDTMWFSPPKGKTQSGVEQTQDVKGERRRMDPRVADALFEAMKSRKKLKWNFRRLNTESGKEGESFNMLDMYIPEIGGGPYAIPLSPAIGGSMRDTREGEQYTLEVKKYDPDKGFLVSFPDFKEKIFKSAIKDVSQRGFLSDELIGAAKNMVSEFVFSEINPMVTEDTPAVVEKYLGRVLVDGKNISTADGLASLGEMVKKDTSQYDVDIDRTQDDELSDDDENLQAKGYVGTYRHRKRMEQERRERQEQALGKNVTKVVQQADYSEKAKNKIADAVTRNLPIKAPFTSDRKTWTLRNAFMSRDVVRGLLMVMMDDAMPLTVWGHIPWDTFLSELAKSGEFELNDVDRILNKKAADELFRALLLVEKADIDEPIGKSRAEERARKDDTWKTLSDYKNGVTKVTPDDKARLSRMLSGKESEDLRKLFENLRNEIKSVMIQAYVRGDKDITDVIQMTGTDLAGLRKKDKELGSLKQRMEDARKKDVDSPSNVENILRSVEQKILGRDFGGAIKILSDAGVSRGAISVLKDIKRKVEALPGDEGELDDENILADVESYSKLLEQELETIARRSMLKEFKAPKGDKSKGEETTDVSETVEKPAKRPRKKKAPVQGGGAPAQSESAPQKAKQATLYRFAVKAAMNSLSI